MSGARDPRRKTDEEVIQFLLAIIEHSETTNYEEVARSTGLYKSGKFVRQALATLKGRYGSASAAEAVASPKTLKLVTPNSKPKKRSKATTDDDDANGTPSKRSKKALTNESSGDELGAEEED
ncbi:hypothetical protein LTR70_006144 [Exophiala xenobiotica]|uniref:Uncharacterized protein n=1 Tax=Lithohypha guttulata TaxID=1690604 RepID=A0ABR0K8H1_9EURO|nr:hypothetical protein LTR24_005619 [Lithohypha guttulata]KAK5316897.1 hypothetical protein LTR70_006144 [Exophiala xenobiotica]